MLICAGCLPTFFITAMLTSLTSEIGNTSHYEFSCISEQVKIINEGGQFILESEIDTSTPGFNYNFKYNKESNVASIELTREDGLYPAVIGKLKIKEVIDGNFSANESIVIKFKKPFNWGITETTCDFLPS